MSSPRRIGPQHKLSKAAQRWSCEQRERIRRALVWLYGQHTSQLALAATLGISPNSVKNAISVGYDVTPELADKLAATLGTTADDIARGAWSPKGRAA